MGAGASGPNRTINVQTASPNPKGSSPAAGRATSPPPATTPPHGGSSSTPPAISPNNNNRNGPLFQDDCWQWEYEEFPGGPFRPFDTQTSRQLEEAYLGRQLEDPQATVNYRSVVIGGRVLHTVNVVLMRAVGPGGAERPIHRVNHETSASVLVASDGKPRPRGSIATEVARQARDPLQHPSSLDAERGTSPSSSSATEGAVASPNGHVAGSLSSGTEADSHFAPKLHSIIKAHASAVYGITFSSEGNRIVTGAKDGSCKHWEVDTSFLITEFERHPGSVLTTAMTPNTTLIATGCEDDKARVFSPKEKEPRAVLEGHEHKVYSIAFTCDGKQLVTTSMDDTLKVWDLGSYQAIRSVVAHRSSIFSFQSSYLTPYLGVTAGDDSVLVSHDFRLNNTVTARYIGHESTLWGCDIRFDDGQFISCGMDARVCLWDPRNPKAPYNVVRSHKNPVHCVEYMPDGRTFLSSARDRSFRLTVANTGKEVFHCVAHEGNVYRVTYNAATSRIMTCGSDALVKLWTLPPVLLDD